MQRAPQYIRILEAVAAEQAAGEDGDEEEENDDDNPEESAGLVADIGVDELVAVGAGHLDRARR